MKRSADIQRQHPTAVLLDDLAQAVDGLARARNDDLAGRIQVGDFDCTLGSRRLGADRLHGSFVQADYRGHAAVDSTANLGHGLGADLDQA